MTKDDAIFLLGCLICSMLALGGVRELLVQAAKAAHLLNPEHSGIVAVKSAKVGVFTPLRLQPHNKLSFWFVCWFAQQVYQYTSAYLVALLATVTLMLGEGGVCQAPPR